MVFIMISATKLALYGRTQWFLVVDALLKCLTSESQKARKKMSRPSELPKDKKVRSSDSQKI